MKKSRANEGGLSPHTWDAYEKVCGELISTFGRDRLVCDLRPEDFELLRQRWAAKWGITRLAAEINRARVVFNYAAKNGMIDKPLQFGDGFERPSKRAMLLNKAARGPRSFQAAELRKMIGAATQPMKAMLLLGVNGGLGNNDIAHLPMTALDLKARWMMYPRPKTGIMRRVPLWPETVEALREWLAQRPTPKDEGDTGLVFLTVRRASWGKSVDDRPITHECRKLLDKLGISGGRGFYGCRHTFEMVGGESRDQVAVDAIMGHSDGSMASNYRDSISVERLEAVVEHVKQWLFPIKQQKEQRRMTREEIHE